MSFHASMVKNINIETAYPKYIRMIKSSAKKTTAELGTRVFIEPTSKKICETTGLNRETANCINTIEYLKAIYSLLKQKGYNIPKIYISEEQIPRKNRLGGLQLGDWNIFGPGKLNIFGPSVAIHECAHFLHKKNMPWNQPFYSLFCSVRNIFRPFLNKKEKEILTNDYKRAYQEGYFKDLELNNSIKRGYLKKEKLKEFKKNPEKFLVKNAFFNVSEFIAEYFTLASRGFEFSPEITKRYEYFHGPKIKDIITTKEIDEIIKYRKTLEKREKIEL